MPLVIMTVIIAFVTLVSLTLFELNESNALIGFLGIIVGSGVAASTSLLIARENRRGQLAISALDKRLEVHQEAYRIWLGIRRSIQQPEVFNGMLEEAKQFWEANCLYLDPKSREAFIDCIFRASTHQDILRDSSSADKERMDSAKESWAYY
ncbi:MAG: hypothetical protein AB2669_13630 [Candidatus Thiodiazotropha endolucinida]